MSLFIPIFSSLNNAEVRYVVVGGLATVLHGYARLTADIDIIIDLEPVEAKKAIRTIVDLGLQPRLPVDPFDFSDPIVRRDWNENKNMQVFSFWKPDDPLISVDFFIKNIIDFEDLWNRSKLVDLEDVSINIASIPDLIKLKKIANRQQDLIDIEKLSEIYQELENKE